VLDGQTCMTAYTALMHSVVRQKLLFHLRVVLLLLLFLILYTAILIIDYYVKSCHSVLLKQVWRAYGRRE